MRKTLSFQEQQLFELFSNFNYKLPKDPELILYDFYFLTAFGEEISGRNMNANYAIEAASNDIVDMLHKHMKDAVFYALCAEIRHLFNYYRISEVQNKISKDDLEFLQEYYKQLMDINNLTSRTAIGLGIGIADEILTISDRDRAILTAADEGSRLKSYRAVKLTMKKLNYSKSRFAIWAENMFDSDEWSSSYGGKPWARIAEALYKLERAGKKQEKIIWIDHAYDLQHNTDTVFNKLKLYYKDGGYRWIKQALDWKRDVTDLKAFYKKVSTQLRPMVAYISKATTGKSIISVEDEDEGHTIAAAKADLEVSADDIVNFAGGLRRDNSKYPFEVGDIVKVVNQNKQIEPDDEVIQWGLDQGITFGVGIALKSGDYTVYMIGEHPKFPGDTIVLINPVGYYNKYLFSVDGLEKKQILKLGTQMHVPVSLVNDLSGSIQDPIEVFTSEDDYTDISSYSSKWSNVKLRTSDLSFAQHHVDEFDWIKEATIKDAHLKFNPDNELIFEHGTWEHGWWKDGIFKDGIWETGHWTNGTFDGGVWKSGKWDTGWWKSGIWESGEIKDAYGDYLYSSDAPE